MTSTTDFFTAVRKAAGGDEATAKTIADYIEENRELNIVKLKDVFMTKDDKSALLDRIDTVKNDLTNQIISLRADINGNLWKLLAAITGILAICTAIIKSS